MRNFVKFGLVGLAGYFVGFYEFKCRTMKLILEHTLEKEKNQKENEAQ